MNDRKKLFATARKLMMMTVEHGATPAEAATAQRMLVRIEAQVGPIPVERVIERRPGRAPAREVWHVDTAGGVHVPWTHRDVHDVIRYGKGVPRV